MNTLTVDFDSIFASLGDDIEEFSFRTQLKVRTILKAIDEFLAIISISKIPVGVISDFCKFRCKIPFCCWCWSRVV